MREKLKVHDGDTPGKVIEVKLEYPKPKVKTMSKDIWHTKDEIPKQESRVLWKSGNIICGGIFDTYYKCFCGPASQFVDLRTVSRWAYIDDLLALENELDRTRKALKIASDCMKIMYDNLPDGNRWKWEIEKTLEQIKTTMQEQPNDN